MNDPILIITEPYGPYPDDEVIDRWQDYCDRWDLDFKIYEPSIRSLWNPNCYQVCWWCPKYFEFDGDILNYQ